MVTLNGLASVKTALAVIARSLGAVKFPPILLASRSPFNVSVLPVKSNVPGAPVVDPFKVMFPPVLVMSPSDIVNPAVNTKLFPAVIICSKALSKATSPATVRLVAVRVRAKSVRFKVVIDRSSLAKVVFPPIVKVVGAVTVAVFISNVPAPVRTRVVPDISKVPLVIVVAAGIVTVPLELVS